MGYSKQLFGVDILRLETKISTVIHTQWRRHCRKFAAAEPIDADEALETQFLDTAKRKSPLLHIQDSQLKLPACNNRTDLEALHLQNDRLKQNSVYILDWTVFFEVFKKKSSGATQIYYPPLHLLEIPECKT